MNNSLITPNIIGCELHILVAYRDAKTTGQVDPHYKFSASANVHGGGYKATAKYRDRSIEFDVPLTALTLNLDEFSERYLQPVVGQLVPRYQALVNQMDMLWHREMRPKLLDLVKTYSEDEHV